MTDKHSLICSAPICQDDLNPNFKEEIGWYPGEAVCLKAPYQAFQEKQLDINKGVKNGTFKHMDKMYTAKDLETRSI